MKLSFGKYNGWELSDVPDDYIEYMITSNEANLKMFRGEKERRVAYLDAKMPMMERIIQAGYRALANQHHPDKGGDTRTMQQVNAAYEKLKQVIK
ncbi:hypothetical protein M0R72_07180 [Candidatus Pacearchaeota archaeon]|jgi:hypothetical protein|nr:hypothetical protein [Candidatus Pacearchaeota archaeon]